MKILTISFFDDNFGDMLIRICFDRLLNVAMKNLGYGDGDYVIDNMHIKKIDEQKLADADLILFSGGAMFGFNNLGSFDAIDRITAIAEDNGTPVIFSSLGINNMHADEESGARLNAILRRRCVRAMSVRESAEIFVPFAEGCSFEVVSVCDPAVWAKHVYRRDIEEVRSEKQQKPIGLNVVRGGLFKANFRSWSIKDEETYFRELTRLLDENGIEYRMFVNGSVLDCNGLMNIAGNLGIPEDKVVCPDTTRELVRTIAGFDSVVAIRMHAGIISYALDIPSVNLIWNEKIPHFYQSIGYPDRAIDPEDHPLYAADDGTEETAPSLAAVTLEKIREMAKDSGYHADPTYMMSLYRFLYQTLTEILSPHTKEDGYDFETVSRLMEEQESGTEDDITDYRTKLARSKYCYQKLSERNQFMRYRNIKMQRYLRKIYSSVMYRSYHFLTGLLKIHEKMSCRPAAIDDLDNVRELFLAATANLQVQKIRQWDESYPTDDDFIPDIKSGGMQLVYKGTRLAGVFTLTAIPPVHFRNGEWNYRDDNHMILVRLALHPDCEGFGFKEKVLTHIIETLRESGVHSLRTDISQLNPHDQKLYRKTGFEI